MTININLLTIATAISNLSIPNAGGGNITIKDITAVPDSAKLLCPLLIPDADNFVSSDIVPTRVTTGGGGSALENLEYNLNYIYLHCQDPGGISVYSNHGALYENLVNIFESIIANDDISGAVDMTIRNISKVGTIKDPSGISFLGVMFSVHILEFVQ